MEKAKNKNFVVVGCGLVGVALAIELKRRVTGCSVTILEKRTEAESMAGSWTISVTKPGLKVLSNNPDLLQSIVNSGQIKKTTKKCYYFNGRSFFGKNDGYPNPGEDQTTCVGVDRAKTLDICVSHLRQEYPDVKLLFGYKLTGIDEKLGTFVTEPPVPNNEFDMLFGADGANSSARRCCKSILAGAEVRTFPLSVLILRTLSVPTDTPDLSPEDGIQLYMSTKPPPGCESGTIKTKFSPISKKLTNLGVAYTQSVRAEGGGDKLITEIFIHRDHIKLDSVSLYPRTQGELKENLRQLGVPNSLVEKLELPVSGSRERVIYTVKAERYHNGEGNVAILGDAAHATYPSLGGGYNTGLQDVETLVDCVLHGKSLSEYSKQRVPVGRALVDISNLLVYSPALPVSSAGPARLIRFSCRALAHYLTRGLTKAPSPFIACRRSQDPLVQYATCEKTTVQLAEKWKREIKRMDREMEAFHSAKDSAF